MTRDGEDRDRLGSPDPGPVPGWEPWTSAPGLVLALGAAVLAVACGQGRDADGHGSGVARDTVADTVVVRTGGEGAWGEDAALVEDLRVGRAEGPPEVTFGRISGLAVSEGGEIHVVDGQAPAVRVFDASGSHLRTLGGEGEGPGEYLRPNGVAVLPDGRAVVRDPRTGRLNVYAPDGEPLDAWPHPRGLFAGDPLVVDTAGRLYNAVPVPEPDPPFDLRVALARHTSDGEVRDTILPPAHDHETPRVTGRTPAGNLRAEAVSFAPRSHWAVSPLGYFVGGVATRYAVNLYRPDRRVLQIRRAYDPVPVKPDEKADHRRYIVDRISSMIPGWEWNGPEIPDEKAPYRGLLVGQGGRVWVQLHRPGRRRADSPSARPGGAVPPRWVEPVVYDVFEPDGRYLGRLRAPQGFEVVPRPVARGDTLWGVVRGELGVQRVARLVVHAGSSDPDEGR